MSNRMNVLDDGTVLTFRFSPLKTLVVNRNAEEIIFGKRKVKFEEVVGFWKNYRFIRRRKVYYVVILTEKIMTQITPYMDEYDVDDVIGYLRNILGDDKYGR